MKHRTVSDVLRLRTGVGAIYGGCCDRFANHSPCDCAWQAAPDKLGVFLNECRELGWGEDDLDWLGDMWLKYTYEPCNICRNPNCTDPTQKH